MLATTWAVETDSLQRHWLQTAYINTELETLWDFIHVGYLKSRMLSSEIHLNSLHEHVSKLNSEMNIELYSDTEVQLQLKISNSITCSYTLIYTCRVTLVDPIIKEHKIISLYQLNTNLAVFISSISYPNCSSLYLFNFDLILIMLLILLYFYYMGFMML